MLWLPPLAVPNSMDAIELPLKDDPKFNAVHGPEDDGSHDVNALLNPKRSCGLAHAVDLHIVEVTPKLQSVFGEVASSSSSEWCPSSVCTSDNCHSPGPYSGRRYRRWSAKWAPGITLDLIR